MFDFWAWIGENDLSEISDLFIERNLTSVKSIINFEKNISKILFDERISQKPHLIASIVCAIQKLKNAHPKMTDKEKAALSTMREQIEKLERIKNEFERLSEEYEVKKKENEQKFDHYVQNLCVKREQIVSTFDDIRICMDDKELSLLCKIDAYKERLDEFANDQTEITNDLDSKLQLTQNNLYCDLEFIKNKALFCKKLIKDYNDHLSARKGTMKERENEILRNVDETMRVFEQCADGMDWIGKDIVHFKDQEVEFEDDHYTFERSEEKFAIIKDHLSSFIDVVSNKVVKKQAENTNNDNNKSSKVQLQQQIISLKQRLKESNKVISKLKKKKVSKPQNVPKEKNKICESAASPIKYFRRFDSKSIDESKWVICNDGATVRGVWKPKNVCHRRFWCVPLQCFVGKNGRCKYSCSIKWTFYDEEGCDFRMSNDTCDDVKSTKESNCQMVKLNWSCGSCIGLTNRWTKQLLSGGVPCSRRWPSWANDSHFDSSVEAPWYLNETITVELDLDARVVIYKKDHKQIKKEKLNFNKAKECTVLLSSPAVIDGHFAYTVICAS